ncbi:hypothetical protein D3C71_1909100 [compost metagenome]
MPHSLLNARRQTWRQPLTGRIERALRFSNGLLEGIAHAQAGVIAGDDLAQHAVELVAVVPVDRFCGGETGQQSVQQRAIPHQQRAVGRAVRIL